MLPGVTFTGHVSTIVCITDDTHPNGQGQRRPYIDYLDKGVAVASGGSCLARAVIHSIQFVHSEMLRDPEGSSLDHIGWNRLPQDLK